MGDKKGTDAQAEGGAAGRTRDEQATSSKTLADLERTQQDEASGASQTGSPTEGSSPAPDGAAGPRGGRADGSDTGGPM